MKKVFISMPMRGKTESVIEKQRKLIYEKLKGYIGMPNRPNKEWVLINSVSTDYGEMLHKHKDIYCLSYSIKCLSDADMVFFAKGWESARGCKIEHEIAEQYGLEIIEE